MDLLGFINRALRPVKARISALIGRGILSIVDDAKKMQLLQGDFLDEETKDALEHFLPYGYSMNPLPGAEMLAVFPHGNREHGIVVAVSDRRFRLKGLASGEVALYTDEGDTFVFKRGNSVELTTKNFKVTATEKVSFITPLFETSAAAKVDGMLTVVGPSTQAAITAQAIAATALASSGPVAGVGVTDTASGATIASIKSVFNAHTHAEHGTGGGTTSPTGTPI